MLVMVREEYERLLSFTARRQGEETCGLLAGIEENGNRIVKKVYDLTNTLHAADRFFMDPWQQLEAIHDMRSRGLRLLGNWHTHPHAPALPSAEDREYADDEKMSYLILSLADAGRPVLRAFRMGEEREPAEEELRITD